MSGVASLIGLMSHYDDSDTDSSNDEVDAQFGNESSTPIKSPNVDSSESPSSQTNTTRAPTVARPPPTATGPLPIKATKKAKLTHHTCEDQDVAQKTVSLVHYQSDDDSDHFTSSDSEDSTSRRQYHHHQRSRISQSSTTSNKPSQPSNKSSNSSQNENGVVDWQQVLAEERRCAPAVPAIVLRLLPELSSDTPEVVSVDERIQRKVATFLAKRPERIFNAHLRDLKSFHNPHILEKIVHRFGVDDHGSNFPEHRPSDADRQYRIYPQGEDDYRRLAELQLRQERSGHRAVVSRSNFQPHVTKTNNAKSAVAQLREKALLLAKKMNQQL